LEEDDKPKRGDGEGMTDSKLVGKTALITGASRGIGRAIASAFADNGSRLALAARNLEDLNHVAESLRARGSTAEPFACDVTVAEQVERLPALVEDKLGGIDILVNNAGAAGSHKFVDHPDDLWEMLLEINLTSVYRVTKAVMPGMINRKYGRIINIASVASKVGLRYMSAYVASKHGVLGLTRALAAEMTKHDITVNAICPGDVDTPMTEFAVSFMVARTGRSEAEARKILEDTNPQQRLISPEEVASLAVWLASDDARGTSGQAINIDGGAVMF
jgi:NAD(P)-dependent dehydrogenase (short-subunit alcohol dehydrogenase family)